MEIKDINGTCYQIFWVKKEMTMEIKDINGTCYQILGVKMR